MAGRSRRRYAAVVAAALALGAVPGVQAGSEEAQDGERASVSAAQAAVRPRVAPPVEAPLRSVRQGTPVAAEALAAAVSDELADDWLGPRVSVTVRDALTGEHLLDRDADREVTPASLTKLLAAAAVVRALPMDEPFRTTAVRGAAGEVVLVAGGDMLLAAGRGDPEAVVGRAGLADLAAQVAAGLAEEAQTPGAATTTSGADDPVPAGDAAVTTSAGPDGVDATAPVRLVLDTTYAAGESRAPGWTDSWLALGYTGPITMLGLSTDRAVPFDRAPVDPAQQAARAFHRALEEAGVDVVGEPGDVVPEGTAPQGPDSEGAALLGLVESAPARDVLSLALAESDNAMTEQLVRQAAVRAGSATDRASVNAWVLDQVAGYGIDTTGVRLADASGLSDGTTIPPRVVADVLVAATAGRHPELQDALGRLPIAGYTGTLWDRFHRPVHEPAVGVARAKTGSLPGVTSLAGLVVTAEGRLLVYALVADRIGLDGAALEARSVLDEVVAELARCGC